jgi:hypothetical protein
MYQVISTLSGKETSRIYEYTGMEKKWKNVMPSASHSQSLSSIRRLYREIKKFLSEYSPKRRCEWGLANQIPLSSAGGTPEIRCGGIQMEAIWNIIRGREIIARSNFIGYVKRGSDKGSKVEKKLVGCDDITVRESACNVLLQNFIRFVL